MLFRSIRAKAVGLATASNWIWNCALAFAVPPLLENINWKMYMIFGTFNGLALIHMFFAAPETKGRTLEEMDDVFDSGKWPWQQERMQTSRLDRLAADIETGAHKVAGVPGTAGYNARAEHVTHEVEKA